MYVLVSVDEEWKRVELDEKRAPAQLTGLLMSRPEVVAMRVT
jgi:hypothetical protein